VQLDESPLAKSVQLKVQGWFGEEVVVRAVLGQVGVLRGVRRKLVWGWVIQRIPRLGLPALEAVARLALGDEAMLDVICALRHRSDLADYLVNHCESNYFY
jgi:hypothetical protein